MKSAHSPSAYGELRALFTRLARFDHLSAIAGWDMQTMMPPGGSKARSEALAELSVLQHQILTAEKIGALLNRAQQEALDDIDQANLLEMRRQHDNAVLIPKSLVEAKSLAGARCEHAWRAQRPANDWEGFVENLREVVKLSRQEAQIRAQAAGTSRYDALLNLYEPGMRSSDLDRIFGELKTWLPDLLQRVVAKQANEPCLTPQGPFNLETQRQLSLSVMKLLGFNFDGGRVDISAHPFCGGIPEDVRITTRYNDKEFLPALLGIVHETGHARYEQNLPRDLLGQPVAQARSTAIHESQSLLFEMQLARGNDFLKILRPLVAAHLGEQPALEESNFIRLNQRVKPGLIRVDADEVSYPAHVILRYEIERALIEGNIDVEDIPALWNEKMRGYLGLDTVGDYRNGCMQDIHWTDGAFGYFPTYTLGAMYAAQLFHSVRQALPSLGEDIAAGNLQPLFNWLSQNIWRHGSRFPTETLIANATGHTLNPGYFRQHLESRYL